MKRRTLLATLGASPVALAARHQPILAREATPTASPGATPAPAHNRSPAALQVRVMTFNIWIGGEQVDFSNVIAAIRAAGADIVGVQEVEGNLRRLADGLGWAYANPRLQVISRYPIIDPPGANGDYVLIQLAPGQVLGVTNVHLPSDPYGTYAFRDGATADEVMTLEMETRIPMLRTKLEAIAPLQAQGIPFVLTGDFNSPSHLDWTGDMGTIGGIERQEFAWPATTLAEASGFQDTYRTIHPDPVQAIGYTWPAGYPAPFTRPDEIFERIDYVWASRGIAVVASDIIGEAEGADVAITVNPFPSDHRGVVAELAVTPATPPVFVSPEHRSLRHGTPLTIRFHARGDESDAIAIVPAGATADAAHLSQVPRETWVDGVVTFGTTSLTPGAWDAILTTGTGEILARAPFWLLGKDDLPTLKAPATPIEIGTAFEVTFQHAPGNRWDWIALIPQGEPDPQNYIGYWYTDARIDGRVTIDTAPLVEWLAAGTHRLLLMQDDGYVQLAETTIDLTAR